jgi:hypothetical protein
MNLLLRINLSLAVIFVLGARAASVAYRSVLQSNATREILAQAKLMMDIYVLIVRRAYGASCASPIK